jgi:hypothetical protein
MEAAGQAAIAAVLMNADMIKHHASAYADWESFDVPGFRVGVCELADGAAREFTASFTEWQSMFRSSSDSGYCDVPDGLEESVGALYHCLNLQSYVMTTRTCCDGSAYFAIRILDRLKAAFRSAWLCRREVNAAGAGGALS